eukprot:GAHX01001506.1.p3 GENE.GAHX01001506.1~~GAHX01001506.1.p3  ORF type:complete len:59 (+),score=8.71 GAHX01001506.1:230-406(+)
MVHNVIDNKEGMCNLNPNVNSISINGRVLSAVPFMKECLKLTMKYSFINTRTMEFVKE